MKRITATEASRSLSLAELRPAPKSSTVADLAAFLREVTLPDSGFRDDMLGIIDQSARDVGRDPWSDEPA